MPYRYFGRTNQDFGRPLWEILMNLKNFGKGRLVTRSAYSKKFPSVPSFYKIVSVHPHLLQYPDDFRGNIFVEEIYRGRRRAEVIDIGVGAERADFELVHKGKEPELIRKVEEFNANPDNHKPTLRPKTAPLPPLWKLLIARDKNISPQQVQEIPILYEDIDPEIHHPTRIAEDGETPDFKIGPGHFAPVHSEFYEHVLWNRDAAREKYCLPTPPDPDFIYVDREYPPLHLEKRVKPSDKSISQST